MSCSRSRREFGLEPAFWAATATLCRLRQGMSCRSWREAMVKEGRAQVLEETKAGKAAEEDTSEARFQSEWSSLRHLGMRGTRCAWNGPNQAPGNSLGVKATGRR